MEDRNVTKCSHDIIRELKPLNEIAKALRRVGFVDLADEIDVIRYDITDLAYELQELDFKSLKTGLSSAQEMVAAVAEKVFGVVDKCCSENNIVQRKEDK